MDGPDGGLGGPAPRVGDDLTAAGALNVFDLQEAAAAAAAAEDGPPPPAGAAPNPSVRDAADRSRTSAPNPSDDSVRDSVVSALYSVTQSTASSQQLRESMAQMLQEIEAEEEHARRKKVTLDEAWAKVQEADGRAAPAPGEDEAAGSPDGVLKRKANSKRGRSMIRTFTAYAAKSRAPWARLGKDGRTWKGYFHSVVLDLLHVLRVYGVSTWIILRHVFQWDTMFVTLSTMGSVAFYCYYKEGSGYDEDGDANNRQLVANISLTLISFTMVMPITAFIGYTFVRREQALQATAKLKAVLSSVYANHCDAVNSIAARGKEGTAELTGALKERHVGEVREVILALLRSMAALLTLPAESGIRANAVSEHSWFRKHHHALKPLKQRYHSQLHSSYRRLFLAASRLSAVAGQAGVPFPMDVPLRLSVTEILNTWNTLYDIKHFRTPYALRAFARVFVCFHGWFVGSYYAWVAGAGNSRWFDLTVREERGYPTYTQWPFQTNITYAVALALFTTIAMQALFDVGVAMEDPFDDFGLDNIDFYTVVEQFESYVLDTDYLSNVWTETVLGGESLLDANMYSHKAVEAALGTMGGSGRLAALRASRHGSHGSLLAGGSPSAHF